VLHQHAVDELGGDLLGWAAEEGLVEVLRGLGWTGWLWEWLFEEMLNNADGDSWIGDDERVHNAILKRCQKNKSKLFWKPSNQMMVLRSGSRQQLILILLWRLLKRRVF
jgi:hypothetical protein